MEGPDPNNYGSVVLLSSVHPSGKSVVNVSCID